MICNKEMQEGIINKLLTC